MIDGVGKAGAGRLSLVRGGAERAAALSNVKDAVANREGAGPASAAAELASAGAPVDVAKVEAIRTAIAEGRYPVDPDKLAASMLAIDLPLFDGK
jgi:negative regulator of flagellin synthesis FlgM